MSLKLISCEKVSFGYNSSKNVLNDVSLTVSENEFITIIGCNGVGKSTLLKLLAKRITGYRGRVTLNGMAIDTLREKEIAKLVGYLEQFPEVTHITVEEYVLMGAMPLFESNRFWYTKGEKARMNHLLKDAGIGKLKKRFINELSGGERETVQICRALMSEPKILLLDEPVSHLDIQHVQRVIELLKKIQHEKKIAIVATLHDLTLAYACCDRILMINEHGSAKELTGNIEQDITDITAVFKSDFRVVEDEKKERLQPVPAWDFSSVS